MSTRIAKALADDKPVKPQAAKPPALKLPKSDPLKADMLYQIREERLALQKKVDALAAQETVLREYFIANLPKSNSTGIAGRVGRVTIESKEIVSVEDWDKVYKAIVTDYNARTRNKSEAFLLLQKRLGEGVAKTMWEAGVKVPGLRKGKVPVVSCVKV